MLENALKGVDIMTDFQFKSIMELVNQILDRSEDLEDAKKAIKVVLGKHEDEKKE